MYEMFDHHTDPALVARCRRLASLCAVVVALLGLGVLAGWVFDIGMLKSVRPEWSAMPFNSALGFVLAGASLAAGLRARTVPIWQSVHLLTAAGFTLIGLAAIAEYGFSVDLGIEHPLLGVPLDPIAPLSPGHMAPAVVAGFIFAGVALLTLNGRCGKATRPMAALGGIVIGTLALVGYAYDVTALYGVGAYTGAAAHAALGLVVIGAGVLLARPQCGLMAAVMSRTAGGVMARRLLPLALVAPFIIGWLHLKGDQLGYYNHEFGAALTTLAYAVLFTAVIWRTAGVLHRSEQDRLAVTRARRKEQAQIAGIIESAMDAIVMVDTDQRIVLFNPAAERMFGRSADQVLGGPLDMLLPERFRAGHIDDIRSFGLGADAKRRIGNGTVAGLRANGEEFPVDISLSRQEVDGETFYTAILRDVTERQHMQEALRESEAHLKLAMEVAKIGTWERNLVSGAGSWSAETKAMLGVDGDAYTLDDFLRLVHPDDLPRMRESIAAPPAGEPFELEYRIVRPDGEVRWINERIQVMRDVHGKPAWSLGAARDVTERRRMEDELRVSKLDAERANNAKSRFLAAASHDLRQPLSALSIYVNLLKGHVTPGGEPMLVNLSDCIASLSELLTDLLDLSKLEAGVVIPNPSDFPVSEVLDSLVAIHSPEAELKGLRLRRVPTRLTAHTDPVLFKRLLGNLISNAVRYAERGGVLVGCRRRGGRSWIEVWDTGVGIPQDKTAEIFEEFRQLGDGARNRGSGLGLAIVAKTAALLGLEVRVRSRPGRGSMFAIELPPGEEDRQPPSAEPSADAYRSLRIALVEDNLLVREALTHALKAAGHRVLDAAGGADLLVGLGRFEPDIIVSDYRLMRGETGFDVIRAVRAATRADLPAILVTGDTDPRLVRSMADRGIIVLHKPLDMETLQAYLEDLTSEDSLAC